jgi:hypothetical protein
MLLVSRGEAAGYQPFIHRKNKEKPMQRSMIASVPLSLCLLAAGLGMTAASAREAPKAASLQVPAPPPVAKVRVLVALLSGPEIEGVVPTAKAVFQAQQGETSLAVGAANLNLPDGTLLTVALDGVDVGAMIVIGGQARLILSPSPQVHAGELITISAEGSVILSGTFIVP